MFLSDVKQEKNRQSLLGEVESGPSLKKVETQEKNPLPDNEGTIMWKLVAYTPILGGLFTYVADSSCGEWLYFLGCDYLGTSV